MEEILSKNTKDAKYGLIGFICSAFIFFSFGSLAYWSNLGGLQGDWRVGVSEFGMGIACLFFAKYYNRKYLNAKITAVFWRQILSESDKDGEGK
ncbi:hypothetical protein LCGC14_0861740 [marine sediment metagenome]|uniref:Uncharacterized protein n=1 Tax=marine sediment metagenome TaxID=412755 RepID=A0A0F9SE64_9ZZZZ